MRVRLMELDERFFALSETFPPPPLDRRSPVTYSGETVTEKKGRLQKDETDRFRGGMLI